MFASKKVLLPLLCLTLSAVYCLAATGQALAAGNQKARVGFKTLGLWQAHNNTRADLAIWYPAGRAPSELQYGPWTIKAARNARELPGRFPLILISHDSPGTRFSHHGSADTLAKNGFVVAALTHHGDNMDDMSHLFTLEQLHSRAVQIRAALDILLSHPDTHSFIDPRRIGIVGFGAGGTVALLLGGARLDGRDWPMYCGKAEADDPYCSPWISARMSVLAASLPLPRPLMDMRVNTVAAVAPAYGMLFTQASLAELRIPTLILRAENDRVNRFPLHADAIKQAMSHTSDYAVITEADSASLMSACPPSILHDLPELCSKVSMEKRTHIHHQLNIYLTRFFLAQLGHALPEEQHTQIQARQDAEPHIEIPPPATPPDSKARGKKTGEQQQKNDATSSLCPLTCNRAKNSFVKSTM
jgi:predicted dienelactone hydrolase